MGPGTILMAAFIENSPVSLGFLRNNWLSSALKDLCID